MTQSESDNIHRHGYAVVQNRKTKAEKILAVLGDYLGKPVVSLKILDIGAGNGELAEHIAGQGNEVTSVDVVDQISSDRVKEIITFIKVEDEALPFADNTFDVVISNHVIEHVPNQTKHLNEINRVLKESGACYFATPNRFFIKEQHTGVFFLHYLPPQMLFFFLKQIGKYQEAIYLLSYPKMKRMFKTCGFSFVEYTARIINHPEKFHLEPEFALFHCPNWLQFLSPINIFVLRKNIDGKGSCR